VSRRCDAPSGRLAAGSTVSARWTWNAHEGYQRGTSLWEHGSVLTTSSWSSKANGLRGGWSRRSLGPCTAIQEPMRSGEERELGTNQVLDLEPPAALRP
jgi:hypothetical protein